MNGRGALGRDVEGDVENTDLSEAESADADDDIATPDVGLDSDMQPAHRGGVRGVGREHLRR